MSITDEVAGVFDVIDSDTSAHEPVDQTEVSENPVAEGKESTAEAEAPNNTEESTETSTETEVSETGKSDEGQTESTAEETDEPLKTETTEQDFSNWKESLPIPPAKYAGKVPEYDEDGNITNMTHPEYQDYIIGKATEAANLSNYQSLVEQRSLDVAEQVLPEMKTNPAVRQMVQNVRLGSLVAGNDIDNVQAAQLVREALNISPQKLAEAKAEGAKSAKASVTIQKAAALETGSTDNPVSEEGEKITSLQKRIAKGDDEAFADLLGILESKK